MPSAALVSAAMLLRFALEKTYKMIEVRNNAIQIGVLSLNNNRSIVLNLFRDNLRNLDEIQIVVLVFIKPTKEQPVASRLFVVTCLTLI